MQPRSQRGTIEVGEEPAARNVRAEREAVMAPREIPTDAADRSYGRARHRQQTVRTVPAQPYRRRLAKCAARPPSTNGAHGVRGGHSTHLKANMRLMLRLTNAHRQQRCARWKRRTDDAATSCVRRLPTLGMVQVRDILRVTNCAGGVSAICTAICTETAVRGNPRCDLHLNRADNRGPKRTNNGCHDTIRRIRDDRCPSRTAR